jgi:hypothetical protein
MSATVYATPNEIALPEFELTSTMAEEDAKDDRFVADLRAWLKDHDYKGQYVGGIIRFPVADGSADYMVMSLRPLKLMHLGWHDAWNADRITMRGLIAQDVKDQLQPSVFPDRYALPVTAA